MEHASRLAAVDLGSNSFRLEIGSVDHGVFRRTEYIKETPAPIPWMPPEADPRHVPFDAARAAE